MNHSKNSLPIPSSVEKTQQAMELVRIWIADGDQHVSISAQLWDDPRAWGLMLVDLAKHVASAYEGKKGMKSEDVLQEIRKAFDAEWNCPTD